MSERRPRRGWRPGALVHASQLWLSELWTVVIAGAIVIMLLCLGARIYLNGRQIQANRRAIAELERSELAMRYESGHLSGQLRLLSALRAFIGNRIPDAELFLLAHLVYHSSETFGYDPLLVLAVIQVESYFETRARGAFRSGKQSGALGLMQLEYETAELVAADLGIHLAGPADLLKPETNVPLGIAYLTQQIRRFRSFKLGLLAYNQGPETIAADLKGKQPLSTGYYQDVLSAYYHLKKIAVGADDDS